MYKSQKRIYHSRSFLIESIGWLGVVLILGAYSLLNMGVLGQKDALYLVLNIIGSLSLVVQSYWKRDYEPVILNTIWVVISLIAVYKVYGA